MRVADNPYMKMGNVRHGSLGSRLHPVLKGHELNFLDFMGDFRSLLTSSEADNQAL
jgi:hypothetical protein